MITTLKEALKRINELERENEMLKAEITDLESRNSAGRKKHDEAWMASYSNFIMKYEGGMTIMEIVEQGEISRRTAYRYKAYYEELRKNHNKRSNC